MKYILEVLDNSGSGSVHAYGSRNEAILAMDQYTYHRPGQPIAAVYIDEEGKYKALLAIGHDYGVGYDSGRGVKRYTIIGDCDGSHSITNYNWASQIKLSRIPYSNLLDDYLEIDGVRRFGYLGTVYDSWAKINGGNDEVPNGATVQEAFEHILLGDRNSQPSDDSLTLIITAIPSEIVENSGVNSYTVTVSADYEGTMNFAKLTASEGSVPSESAFLNSLRLGSWSQPYTVDFSTMTADTKTITYTATAKVGNITQTASATVVLRKEGSEPEPQTVYKVYYHAVDVCSGTEFFETATGSIPSLRSAVLPSGWSISDSEHWQFDGWTKDPNGQGPKISGLSSSDFVQEGNAMACHVYSYCIAKEVGPTALTVNATAQTETYTGQEYVYDYQNRVTVTGGGENQPITWTGSHGVGNGFTVDFVGDDVPKGTNAGAYTNSVVVSVTDTEKWTEPGPSAVATLTINKRTASITVKINNKTSESLTVGSTAPSESFTLQGFTTADATAINGISNWGQWNPALSMTTVGTYTLSFEGDLESVINTDNYQTITKTDATLEITELPLQITFDTDTTGTGITTHDAKKATSAASSANVDHSSVMTAPSNTTAIVGWWVIYANNTNPLASTTTIDSNKPITITGLKYWDEATSSWGTRTISAITPSGQASHFVYALRVIPPLVNTEECFLAINITE